MIKINLITHEKYKELCNQYYDIDKPSFKQFSNISKIKTEPLFSQIPFKYVDAVDISWDTKFMNIETLKVCDFCHEAAHYFIAPNENKKLPNFGLGPGFQDSIHSERILSPCDAGLQEELACVLEWSFMKYMKCSDDEISEIIFVEDMSYIENDDYTADNYNYLVDNLLNLNNKFEQYGFQVIKHD
jgi:hypothetical protein